MLNNIFILDSYIGLMIPRGFVVFMKSTFKFLEESRRIRCIILEVSRRILSMDIYRSYVNSAWLFEFLDLSMSCYQVRTIRVMYGYFQS